VSASGALLDLSLEFRRPRSLSDQIYLSLRDAIIKGSLPAGSRLLETDIAHRMGTSQAPVREAVQHLVNDGLVVKPKRSSAVVAEATLEDYYELFQVRSLIERLAVRRVAGKVTDEQCRILQQLIDRMCDAAGDSDLLTLSVNDMEFHRLICEWSDNPSLLRAWLPLSAQVLHFLTQYEIDDYESPGQIAEEHRHLLAALCSGDTDRAEALWNDHVLTSFRRLEDVRRAQSGVQEEGPP
jgi:DNA-binding GntR family transcriptional regulator